MPYSLLPGACLVLLGTGCAGSAFDAQEQAEMLTDYESPSEEAAQPPPSLPSELLLQDASPPSPPSPQESEGAQEELRPGRDLLNVSAPPPKSPESCENGSVRECTITLPSHNGVVTCIDGLELCAAGSFGECQTLEQLAVQVESAG